jgi:hypothetical protein
MGAFDPSGHLPSFHFVPGGMSPPRRLDGARNPWSVAPDSKLARAILERAEDRDPFRWA